jgi:hypothetical protein
MKKKVCFLVVVISGFLHADERDFPIGFPYFKTPQQDRRVGKTAQSFLFTRPIFQNYSAQLSSYWHDAVYDKIGCLASSMQVIPMYQHSFHTGPISRYFLFNHKNSLVVKGDNVPANLTDISMTASVRDVRAEWLQLPSDFVGLYAINPAQKQYGVWFEFNQDLKKFSCNEFFSAFWVGAAFVFQVVENQVRPKQSILSPPPTTFPKGIIESFNRTNLLYGKMADVKRTKKSVSEIQLKLGTTFMARDGFQLGMYSSLVVPTAGSQKADYMFNPFLGHNGHWGFGTGVNMQFPLNSDVECRLIALYFNIENIYFLRNYQRRTLDLNEKPWSRYMLLNKLDGTKNIPAANVLTPKVRVQSFNFVDLSAGFRFQVAWAEFDIGYDLWAHGDEELLLKKPFPEEYGIAAANGIVVPGTNIGATASRSTIKEQAGPDLVSNPFNGTLPNLNVGSPTFITIKERDLDLLSGSARGAVAHRAHLAIGVVHDQCTFALFCGIGGFVEIPQRNTSLKNWGAWGKVGGTF